jgi:hypothetical protein
LQKRGKKKIHPTTHHPHTEFSISSHSLLVCSGFKPAIIIPREHRSSFLLLSLLDHYRSWGSWWSIDRS